MIRHIYLLHFLHSQFIELLQMGICSFLFSLIILLIISARVIYYAQGVMPVSKRQAEIAKVDMASSMMIGSRPPRCEGRCSSCGRCEAVQVPVTPNDRRGTRHAVSKRKSADSLSDDTSNYKPMSWKCKCGERIFNP